MSEETQVKAVEDENPSAAEKETKALKKMGANIGEETITKVDLRQPKEEASAEDSTKEEEPVKEEIVEKQSEEPVKEESEEPIIEEIKEDSKAEETPAEEPAKEEPKAEEPIKEENIQQEQPEVNVPEGILELVNFMNETGGSMEDYVKLNKNYEGLEDTALIKEYYSTTKPHLDSDEINFLVEDQFSFDKELDDPTDIKRKELAYKEEVANAKQYLEGQKDKYYKEVRNTGNLSTEQQKAVDFFNRYNTEQQEIAHQQEKATNQFTLKTNEVFNQEFKGFDFNIDNKKYRYKLKDVDNVKKGDSEKEKELKILKWML